MELRDYLEKHDMTASDLAKKAMVPVACITRYLRKDQGRGLSPETAAKISSATTGEVTISELLYPDGIMPGAKFAVNN